MKKIVVSLGGSVICPEELDIEYLKDLKNMLASHDAQFIIITGGGKTSRKYQAAARALGDPSHEDLDWLGIQATRMHAKLLQILFGAQASPEILRDHNEPIKMDKKYILAAGSKTGSSSDYDAVMIAKANSVDLVYNVTNVDYVYDNDPSKSPSKPVTNISWDQYLNIIGENWKPGMNSPFDPVASKIARDANITVVVLGKNLQNLENALRGKTFKGTTIK